MSLAEFRAEMNRVAEANSDEWKVTVELDNNGYSLEVLETADKHTILYVRGKTVSHCIARAFKELPDALASWGYKMPLS